MLMIGLSSTSGGSASLLLNLEAVFTAAIAWFVFKEHFDKRIFVGMLAIVAGSAVLSFQAETSHPNLTGILLIALACLCWALDNNLTRNIADADAVQIASAKGLVAGTVNCLIAFACGASLPPFDKIVTAAFVGFAGYGISLVLFILALRKLGTSRAGAYFSTAPFAGAILSLIFLHEAFTPQLLISGLLMGAGVWLHLTEHHEHEHSHDSIEHEHLHMHDEHHQHEHTEEATPDVPHGHWHAHPSITHSHPHFPDSQHRHQH
jgi:drug/metabolite transporter (DMT)-like permease